MAKGIGRLLSVGLAKETTRGTAAANASFWINQSELSIDEKREFIQDDTARGVIADAADAEISKSFVEASLRAPVGANHFGLILLGTLGQVSTTGPTDSAYTHTFSVLNSGQHPSMTIFFDDPIAGADKKFALGVITDLELNAELGKYFEYNASFLAKPGIDATLTPASSSDPRFRPKDICVYVANDIGSITASNKRVVEAVSIKISKNVEEVLAFCEDTAPKDFVNKTFAVEGELTAVWENESDYMNDFKGGTAKAFRIEMINTDVTIGTATHPKLTIDLPKVIYQELTRAMGNDETVKQTISFKAYFDTTTGKQIEAKLVNTTSAY